MIFSPSQQLSTRPPLNVTFSRGKLSLLRLKSSRNLYSDSQRNGRDRGEMRNIFPTTLETAPCGVCARRSLRLLPPLDATEREIELALERGDEEVDFEELYEDEEIDLT